jgi:uncharacterized protein (TIGR03000 family)
MYSVVLLAAITTGDAAPAHGWTRKWGYAPSHGACYGACYGYGYTGWNGGHSYGAGCWGASYGGYWPGYACHGGCGCYHSAAYGVPTPPVAVPMTYAPVDTPTKENGKDKEKEKDKGKGKDKIDDENQQVRARLIFELPQGAQLYVDGSLIPNADTRKSFRTPALRRGEQYFYDLRAEVVRDGKTLVETRRVTLTAGEVIRADFSTLGGTTGVAAR